MSQIKRFRPVIIVAIAVLSLALIAFVSGALDKNVSGPVGYVDGARLSQEFQLIVDLQDIIDKETSSLQEKFDAETKNMTSAEKEKLFSEYQEDLNKRLDALQIDEKLQIAQMQLINTIGKIAEQKGLSTVIDAGVVYFGNPALDITEAVLAEGIKASN